MSKILENKTCLVTGASSGIGACIAKQFAKQGAKVILVSNPQTEDDMRKIEQECKGSGSACECMTCDLSELSNIQELCSKCGDVDILVNNAGVFGVEGEEQGPLKGQPENWQKMMNVNVLAPMALTRHFAPKMVEKGGGHVINIGDVEGIHSGPRHAAYAASKHALTGWSLSCYENLREKNVSVCLISPGNVKSTKMMEETGKGEAGQGMIEPDDVAAAALFCVSGVSKNCVAAEMELKALRAM